MAIPPVLLRDTVTVEAYLGDGARGPLYGAPQQVPCYLERKTRVARAPDGREVTSSSQVFCDLGPTVTTESRVTLPDGTRPAVLQVAEYDTHGLVQVDHLEIYLQ
ncbi:hypothetical protein ACWERV_17050 [Streptomyces sp. NPDC004031]